MEQLPSYIVNEPHSKHHIISTNAWIKMCRISYASLAKSNEWSHYKTRKCFKLYFKLLEVNIRIASCVDSEMDLNCKIYFM
jgi:hypothetical protein